MPGRTRLQFNTPIPQGAHRQGLIRPSFSLAITLTPTPKDQPLVPRDRSLSRSVSMLLTTQPSSGALPIVVAFRVLVQGDE